MYKARANPITAGPHARLGACGRVHTGTTTTNWRARRPRRRLGLGHSRPRSRPYAPRHHTSTHGRRRRTPNRRKPKKSIRRRRRTVVAYRRRSRSRRTQYYNIQRVL